MSSRTNLHRDPIERAKTELRWLWLDYPAMCYGPSVLEAMVYGFMGGPAAVPADVAAVAAERKHVHALDIRRALDAVASISREILILVFHPSSGAESFGEERVASRLYRHTGDKYRRAAALKLAKSRIDEAVSEYAVARWGR